MSKTFSNLHVAIEAAIMVLFLIIALVVILGRSEPLNLEPLNVESYVKRGDQLLAAGSTKFNEAAIQYREAIKLDPDAEDISPFSKGGIRGILAGAHFKLAAIYYEYVWNHEALHELSEVERIDPNYLGLYLLLGKIYHRMGDTDKALQSLQRAVAMQPGNSEARYYLGTIYQQQNMEEKAISEYERAVESGSDSASVLRAYLQLGRIYKGKDERKEAEDKFKKALSVDQTSEEVISELRGLYEQEAEDYENRGEHNKAAEKYEEIIRIDPSPSGRRDQRNVEIYMKLGNIYRSNELYYRAAAAYEAATKLDPLNFDAFSALKELELLKNTDK